jgi:hypothetical protein
LKLLDYWNFEAKFETYEYQRATEDIIYKIGNDTNICSAANATTYRADNNWPKDFASMTQHMFDGVYIGLGMKLPVSKLEKETAQEIAIKSWKIVFIYYWSSFVLLITCSIVFLVLIRRHRSDIFDYVSIGSRIIAVVVGGALLGLVANYDALYSFIRSPAVMPVCLSLLLLILIFDKLSATFANYQLKKSGEPYALEFEEEHHHGGGGDAHEDAHGHATHVSGHRHDDLLTSLRKSVAWSTHDSDMIPLTAPESTEYHHGEEHTSYAMGPLMSPPLVNVSAAGAVHHSGSAPVSSHGGYAPVSNYGA